jgi:hypothetical protein
MPSSWSTVIGQHRSTAGTWAQSIAAGSSLTVQLSSLEWFGAIRVIAASSGAVSLPYSFTIELLQSHTQGGPFLSRQWTRVSTSANLEYDLVGRFGELRLTAASSATYLAGFAACVPVQ